MRKRTRRIVALLTLLGFLIFQGSVAAHACAIARATSGGERHAVVPSGATAASHCNGMHDGVHNRMHDNGAAGTCLEHCSQGDNANRALAQSDIPAAAPTAFLVVAPAAAQATLASVASSVLAPFGAAPPPLVLSQRLRI